MHLLTGATAIGIEIQPELARAARALAARLRLDGLRFIEGDATALTQAGTVYFLYCPFSGERLARFLDTLEEVARPIRICCVDVIYHQTLTELLGPAGMLVIGLNTDPCLTMGIRRLPVV